MPKNLNNFPVKRLVLALTAVTALGVVVPAHADTTEDLLDKLKEKGVLTDDEYSEMRTQAREQRRKQALKEAQDADKAAKAAEDAKHGIVGKFKDGFSFSTADGQNTVSFNGRLQADYRQYRDNSAASTIDIRRAFIGAKGTFYNDISFNITGDVAQASTSNNNPQLDEAYVNFGWFKPAQLRIGQMHMPFGLEKLTSDLFTDFQERYIGDSMIPDKLRGMFVHGAPTTGLYYGLGISNGNGAKNANDANALADGKQAVGRISINIAQMLGDANAVYHLGTSFAHTTGTTTIQTPFAPNTESRGLAGFGASAFNGAPTERKISGLEGAIAYGPFKVQAEALKTSYSGTTTALVDYDRDIKAHYVTAAWLITGERYADAYANGVFGRIRPNSNFNGHSGTGAWEVAIRASEWDAGDFQTSNVTGTGQLTAGKTNKIKATTLGLKWIVNPNTRVILNYIESKYDTPVTITNATLDKEQAVTMRAQFDF